MSTMLSEQKKIHQNLYIIEDHQVHMDVKILAFLLKMSLLYMEL